MAEVRGVHGFSWVFVGLGVACPAVEPVKRSVKPAPRFRGFARHGRRPVRVRGILVCRV